MTLACASLTELAIEEKKKMKKNYVLWFVGLIIIVFQPCVREIFVQVQVQKLSCMFCFDWRLIESFNVFFLVSMSC